MAKRQLVGAESLSEEANRFYKLLEDAEDATVIIVGVAYIDACVAALLARNLLKSSVTEKLLDARGGAIGSFSTRASLAYALRLITKSVYQDLQTLAELRNVVAHHHLALDFKATEVAKHCLALKCAAELQDHNTGKSLVDEKKIAIPRNRFVLTAVWIANVLLPAAMESKA